MREQVPQCEPVYMHHGIALASAASSLQHPPVPAKYITYTIITVIIQNLFVKVIYQKNYGSSVDRKYIMYPLKEMPEVIQKFSLIG